MDLSGVHPWISNPVARGKAEHVAEFSAIDA